MKCLKPIGIKKHERDTPMYVPCGQCISCRINKARSWVSRMVIETKKAQATYHAIITYNDENIPLTKSGYTVRKEDIQKFLKRLRKKIVLRYYLIAEYGEKELRAHYHAILFIYTKIEKDKLYMLIKKTWGKGDIQLKDVHIKNLAYVAQYNADKITGSMKEHLKNQNLDIELPFALMSRNPGIGNIKEYEQLSRIIRDDKIIYGGKSFPISRYTRLQARSCDLDLFQEKLLQKQKETAARIAEHARRRAAGLKIEQEDLTAYARRVYAQDAFFRKLKKGRG